MLKSLEIVNSLLEEKENECYKAYGIFLEKQIKELRTIKQDLEIFEKLLKYIRYEENYKSVDGQSLTFNYDRIILKTLNNFDLIGIPLPQVKEKIKDFVIIKNYILINKVGDNHD